MKKILIIMGRYLPGYKTGGPVRSTKNLVDALGKEYDIRILCQDRDIGDKDRYPGIEINTWNQVGNAKVYYIPEKGFDAELLIQLSKDVDIFYLWGCFNVYTMRVLYLKHIKKIRIPVVVASMGLFSPNAFRMKYPKKKAVITLFNLIGISNEVYWSVTSEKEKNDLLRQVRTKESNIYIAQDMPRIVSTEPVLKEKKVGSLKVAWVGRIAENKNLIQAVRILQKCSSDIKFDIYGPVFEKEYWEACQNELAQLPENVAWEWHGNLESELVVDTLKEYHVFLFPSWGENFGHVIHEALSAGCAVIVSDQTPWKDFESKGVGYVFPLSQDCNFVNAVELYAQMNQEQLQKIADKSLKYAFECSSDSVINSGYRAIFEL